MISSVVVAFMLMLTFWVGSEVGRRRAYKQFITWVNEAPTHELKRGSRVPR